MDAGAIGGAIGVAIGVAIVMPLMVNRQRKKLEGVEKLLRESGAMTFDDIAKKLNTGVFTKGYLLQALDKMVAEGKLQKIPPPKGTPMLRIVRDTQYKALPSSGDSP